MSSNPILMTLSVLRRILIIPMLIRSVTAYYDLSNVITKHESELI